MNSLATTGTPFPNLKSRQAGHNKHAEQPHQSGARNLSFSLLVDTQPNTKQRHIKKVLSTHNLLPLKTCVRTLPYT